MRRSRNEVTSLFYKAIVGAGFDVAAASECAKAAVWLCANGHDGAGILLHALNEPRQSNIKLLDDTVLIDQACAIACGPSVIDLIAAGKQSILMRDLNAPWLVLGLVANAAPKETTLNIDYEAHTIARWKNDTLEVLSEVPAQSADVKISTRPADNRLISESPNKRPIAEPLTTDEAAMQSLAQLAAKTYVPTTEHSRLKGAGAGTTDND